LVATSVFLDAAESQSHQDITNVAAKQLDRFFLKIRTDHVRDFVGGNLGHRGVCHPGVENNQVIVGVGKAPRCPHLIELDRDASETLASHMSPVAGPLAKVVPFLGAAGGLAEFRFLFRRHAPKQVRLDRRPCACEHCDDGTDPERWPLPDKKGGSGQAHEHSREHDRQRNHLWGCHALGLLGTI
jgi:hypothetical protein